MSIRRLMIMLLAVVLLIGIYLVPSTTPSKPKPVYADTDIIVDGAICTLKDAILAANSNNTSGGCVAGTGTDTLILNTNVNLTVPEANSSQIGGAFAGLPDIESPIIIQAGTGNTISANNTNFRIFNVGVGASLTLKNLILTGGRVSPATGFAQGGAIYADINSDLIIQDSTIHGNTAKAGATLGFPSSIEARGGAIYNLGDLNIARSSFYDNYAQASIDVNGGAGYGGAIFTSANTTIDTSAFYFNESSGGNAAGAAGLGGKAFGGAIAQVSAGGTMAITNSTISENRAIPGAALGGSGSSNGGAVYINNATAVINHITAIENDILNGTGEAVFKEGTGTASVRGSILYSDSPPGTSPADCGGTFVAATSINNLRSSADTSCSAISSGIIRMGIDVELVFKNNGGTTVTHNLANIPGNLAKDIDTGCSLGNDQRISARDVNCDVGSYEIFPTDPTATPTNPAITATNTPTRTPTKSLTPSETPSLTPTLEGGTTVVPTTAVPTTVVPTTAVPTTAVPTTPAPSGPPPPTLLAPAHRTHTTDRTPLFRWRAVPGYTTYRIIIYKDDLNRTRVQQKVVSDTKWTPKDPLPRIKLLWRVRTKDPITGKFGPSSKRFTLFID